jgi:hypothetical protein
MPLSGTGWPKTTAGRGGKRSVGTDLSPVGRIDLIVPAGDIVSGNRRTILTTKLAEEVFITYTGGRVYGGDSDDISFTIDPPLRFILSLFAGMTQQRCQAQTESRQPRFDKRSRTPGPFLECGTLSGSGETPGKC